MAGIDLLRGIAVGLVMLRHAAPSVAPGSGVVGVVMFFALSGYLITGLLRDEIETTGRLRFGRFYGRRARRLVPGLVFMLAAFALVTLTLDPLDDRATLPFTVTTALTWTANLPIGHASPAAFHLWTLATEEQFYLLWPAVLVLLGRFRGVLLALVGTALALVVTVWWFRAAPDDAYALPTSWAVCFVIGAGAQLYGRRIALPRWAPPVALTALVALGFMPLRGHAWTYLGAAPVVAGLTAVVLLSWRTWYRVESPVLRPLVWLGTVSYAAYLWDYPLTLWLRPHTPYAGPLAAGLTVVAAAVSWYAVERPVQRWLSGRSRPARAGRCSRWRTGRPDGGFTDILARMPELPEVEALAAFLREHATGRVVTRVDQASFSAVKTFDPPLSALAGMTVTGANRYGKFLDLEVDGLHLITHLSRAGWLRWSDNLSPVPPKPGKGPLALRVHLLDPETDAAGGFDLTEAGTQKRLAVYLVRDPSEVPGIAALGPDALAVSREQFGDILGGERQQIKGALTSQSVLAGIGNAYSDEILHTAHLSPFKLAARLTDAELDVLYDATVTTLRAAVERSVGQKAATLKGEKRSGLQVHARNGLPCPVCGDTVREVSLYDKSFQYCPTCQTGGKLLADRRLSRILK